MRRSPQSQSLVWFLLAALFFSIRVGVGIFLQSPTADEPAELANGYFYWKGDVASHYRHPPFSKLLQALPARAFHLQEPSVDYHGDYLQRATDFLFTLNRDRFEAVMEAGRGATWLMGLGLGLLLFLATRKSPRVVVFTAMALWAFEPNLCAFSGLAVSDLPLAFFTLAAVMAFQKHLEAPGPRWALAAGLLAGMAVTSKFSGLVLLPIFAFLEWEYARGKRSKKASWLDWGWGGTAFLAWVLVLYLPGHSSPFGDFLGGLKDMMDYGKFYHHPSFFLGVASRHNHWLYFPVAFLLKSTLPFLLLLCAAVLLVFRRGLRIPAWVWLPPLAVFLSIFPVQNLGVRYLLPAYPFLILLAAFAAQKIAAWPQGGRLALGGLLLWHATTALAAGPDQLSYFNDLVPSGRKIYFLGDSNLDWGQDVKRLARTGKERGWAKVKLACFTGVDPRLYGLAWEPWTQKDLTGPQPGQVYVVDASFLQLGPVFYPDLEKVTQSWISSQPPTGKVGDSWYYFEIPGQPQEDRTPPLLHCQGFRNHQEATDPP